MAGLLLAGLVLSGCQNAFKKLEVVERPCLPPQRKQPGKGLQPQVVGHGLFALPAGLRGLLDRLLEIAAGNPSLDNKKQFSELLLRGGERGPAQHDAVP